MTMRYYRSEIDHEAINDILRGHRHHMSYEERVYLQRLRGNIHNYLKGDLDDVTVKIHFEDSLWEPVIAKSGDGCNILNFYIGSSGMRYEWEYRTVWRRTKDFLSSAANGIVGCFKSAFNGVLNFTRRLAIGW